MNSKKTPTIIASYSLDGKLVKTYKTAKEAALAIGVFSRSIDKAIREGKIIHQKMWKRVDQNNVPNSISPHQKNKAIISIRPLAKIDESNKVIKTYPSIKNAAEKNDVDPHTIRDVLSEKTRYAKGNKYRYLSEEEIVQFGYRIGKERIDKNKKEKHLRKNIDVS